MTMLTRETLRLFRNSNAFLRNVNTQYDSQFAQTGAKIGNTLNIRLPVDYAVGMGPTITPQNTVQTQTSLSITNQLNVPMSFSSVDLTMSMDEFSDRIIAPAVNVLAGQASALLYSTIDQALYGGQGPANGFVHNVDSNGNTITPGSSTILQAGAILTNNGAPEGAGKRIAMLHPNTEARLVSGLMGLFNPQRKISEQYRTGLLTEDTLGFDFFHDQPVPLHTTGSFTAATINGANQTGTALTVSGLTGTLNAGDIFTIAGVYAVNRVTKQSTGQLKQFVVTAPVASGATSIPIYPALTPTGGTAGTQVAYGTVVSSPANGAALTLVNNAGEIYRNNICFTPEAFTFATADLDLPRGMNEAARETYDGVSMRMLGQYNIMTDQWVTRLDLLCGMALLRPEWVVRLADQV